MMKIDEITVKSFSTGSFCHSGVEGIRHVKNIPFLSIVQSVEGHYDIGIDKAPPASTAEGGIFIAPALSMQTIVHHENPIDKRMWARWVFLDICVNQSESFDILFDYPLIPEKKTVRELREILDELFACQDVIDKKICCYRLVKVLLTIAKAKPRKNTYIHRALIYISTHYQKPLTVLEIADHVGLSPSRLYALFHRHLGISPIAYLNQMRLSKACLLLENTDCSISQIAEACGISDTFYFSKLFKKKHGIPPKEYRKKTKALND